MDDLIFEGITKPENEIEKKEKFFILKKPKKDNEIENKDKFVILSNKKENEEIIKPENLIQRIYAFNIPKTIKENYNKIINIDNINKLIFFFSIFYSKGAKKS